MATYAVGDIQGCYDSLLCVLDQCQFNPSVDKLWVAGDIVNRGPKSLKTLRFLHSLGDAVVAVLGNHDLHLLATAFGCRSYNNRDTLEKILKAPDRDQLLHWMMHRKLVHHDPGLGFTMVHAGIPPQWSIEDALQRAAEIEAILQGKKFERYFETLYGNKPDKWDDDLKGPDRWRVITNYFTRMRFCTKKGRLELTCTQPATSPPKGFAAWYSFENRVAKNDRILFGHWASLQGVTNTPNVFALDTGCVWGGQLSMMRLEDQAWFRCKC